MGTLCQKWKICNLNNSPPPPPIWIFRFLAVEFRPPVPKSCQMPHPWDRLIGQDRFKTICYKYQLAFWTSSVTFKSVPEFLQAHSVTNLSAKSLNIFSSLVVYERSNSPPSAACCQTPGGNDRGMPGSCHGNFVAGARETTTVSGLPRQNTNKILAKWGDLLRGCFIWEKRTKINIGALLFYHVRVSHCRF